MTIPYYLLLFHDYLLLSPIIPYYIDNIQKIGDIFWDFYPLWSTIIPRKSMKKNVPPGAWRCAAAWRISATQSAFVWPWLHGRGNSQATKSKGRGFQDSCKVACKQIEIERKKES